MTARRRTATLALLLVVACGDTVGDVKVDRSRRPASSPSSVDVSVSPPRATPATPSTIVGGAVDAGPVAPADVRVARGAAQTGGAFAASPVGAAFADDAALEVQRYAAWFERRIPRPAEIPAVCVRVVRSDANGGFARLDPNAERRFVLATGPAGAARYPDRATDRDVLVDIGYPSSSIDDYVAQGVRFAVVVFPAENGPALPATWANVLASVAKHYPEAWPKIAPHAAALSTTPLDAIERAAGFRLDRAPAKMDLASFLRSDGTLVDARRFLHDVLSLNRLYAGDGFTRRVVGERVEIGVAEHILPAGRIADLGPHVVLPLDVR